MTIVEFLREAFGGTRRDFTQGSIGLAIALLAVPMVMEMSMESLFGLVDVYFVNRLGQNAVATVVLTESVLILIFGIAIGLSISTTAMVARRFGEKDVDGAARSAVQAIYVGVAVSLTTGMIGLLAAPRMLEAMGAAPEIVATGAAYTRIVLGGSITIFLLFLLNAIFRGAGDASMSFRSLVVANSINIALNPTLILGLGPFPELGLQGSAVATVIGRGTGVLYQLFVLTSGRGRIHLRPEHWRWDPATMWRLLRVSFNGILQVQIATASWLGMVRVMSTFGSSALAGYGIAMRVMIAAFLPAWGLSNAAATLVGQNLGAKKPARAESAVWTAGFYNMCVLGVVAALFFFGAERIIGLFGPEAPAVPYGVDCLRFISAGFLLYAWGMVSMQAFNGSGDTRTPTLINLFCYWMFQIPLAYVLSQVLGYGPRGVYSAIVVAQCTLAIMSLLLFRRGAWKATRI